MALPRSLISASQLDRRLPELKRAASTIASSHGSIGWITTLRESLGLTVAAMARRLKIAPQNVAKLEASERAGTITLASLRRAAEALDADLVYAIVPRKKLRDTIRARARELALQRVAPVAHSMQLEAQGLSKREIKEQIEELARDLERRPRDLWR
jgi:predicted DNA-binding mobile mystery protein A